MYLVQIILRCAPEWISLSTWLFLCYTILLFHFSLLLPSSLILFLAFSLSVTQFLFFPFFIYLTLTFSLFAFLSFSILHSTCLCLSLFICPFHTCARVRAVKLEGGRTSGVLSVFRAYGRYDVLNKRKKGWRKERKKKKK